MRELEPDWIPVDGDVTPDEVRYMDDVDLVPDLTHPVRSAIMRRLRQPRSVAQLAEALDVPITRLYHHINRLDDLGLIRVVATRRVGAVTERCYQVTATSWKLAENVFETLDPSELSQALGSLFDQAKNGLQREVESGLFERDPTAEQRVALSLGELRLTPDRAQELVARLEALGEEFSSDADEDDPDSVRTVLFLATYPEY